MSDTPLYEKIISENADKGSQLRLVVNEFRGVEYVHLRKYFLSYEGDYLPTSEGASMPASIESIFALLEGLLDICSYEENKQIIREFLETKLNEQTD